MHALLTEADRNSVTEQYDRKRFGLIARSYNRNKKRSFSESPGDILKCSFANLRNGRSFRTERSRGARITFYHGRLPAIVWKVNETLQVLPWISGIPRISRATPIRGWRLYPSGVKCLKSFDVTAIYLFKPSKSFGIENRRRSGTFSFSTQNFLHGPRDCQLVSSQIHLATPFFLSPNPFLFVGRTATRLLITLFFADKFAGEKFFGRENANSTRGKETVGVGLTSTAIYHTVH